MANNNDLGLTQTIQSQVTQDEHLGLDVLPLLIRAGTIIPPYWSRARDFELSRFWMNIDHVSSAFSMFVAKSASIPLKIVPRDPSIKAHRREAEYLNAIIIEGSDFGKGWHNSLAPHLIMSLITQDNGMFCEVIGDGPKDAERQGPLLGLAYLDPQRCQRTSNAVYPVIYQDIGGERYRLHHSRVMYTSSMPSYNVRLNGVGFCALSRMINTAQHLLDLSTTEQEELGSRPKRRLIIGQQGITAQEIVNAFNLADTQMDSEGLSRYSKSVVIGASTKPTANNPIVLDIKDLTSVVQGDDKERSITLGMFLIALALNIPPRWLWPATSTGATKADAMFQHIAGMGGGIGYLLQMFTQLLGGGPLSDMLKKPVPSRFKVIFDFQDDEQDRQRSEIQKLRAEVWQMNLINGVIDVRTAREEALEAGDITEQQFEQMELDDGRLADGTSILNLFMTGDKDIQEMLAISVGDVLNVQANDSEFVLSQIDDRIIQLRALIANPPRPQFFNKARQAIAALEALRDLYEKNNPAVSDKVEEPNAPVEQQSTPPETMTTQIEMVTPE